MHHMIRRAAVVAGATTAALAMTAGSALAHECYIANRSAQGNEAAGSHSQVWEYLALVDDLVDSEFWTPDQGECVQTAADAAGVPTSIAIMGKVPAPMHGVLGSKNPNHDEKMGDGKGIDEFFSSGQIMALIGIANDCGAPIPQ